MKPPFLAEDLLSWLSYLETLHPKEIDLGLERVSQVRDKLGLSPSFPIVTIGGTNGKGSTVTMLSTILTKAGYRVGLYTSPHLFRFNERISLNLVPVSDQLLVNAFREIERIRQETSLSYFEYTTLAAMKIFIDEKVDIVILEVGLGGRLDATNIFDPDIAAVVTVDIDHTAYLGDSREKIAREKAGIFRPHKPALCADLDLPQSLVEYAHAIGAQLECYGKEFGYHLFDNQWSYFHHNQSKHALPLPALRGKTQLVNASLVLTILEHLRNRLPVSMGDIKRGLVEVTLPGRFQVLPGRPTVILDVGHNAQAAKILAQNLDQLGFYENTYAVFGMMQDKDMAAVIDILRDKIDHWFVSSLSTPRSATAVDIEYTFNQAQLNYQLCQHIKEAYSLAKVKAKDSDRIVVFGSFLTVAEIEERRLNT